MTAGQIWFDLVSPLWTHPKDYPLQGQDKCVYAGEGRGVPAEQSLAQNKTIYSHAVMNIPGRPIWTA
jgi:hypothetical protein